MEKIEGIKESKLTIYRICERLERKTKKGIRKMKPAEMENLQNVSDKKREMVHKIE